MDRVNSLVSSYFRKFAAYADGESKVAVEEVEREVRVELKELPGKVKKEAVSMNILQAKMAEIPGGYIRVRKETPGKCYFTKKIFKEHSEDNIEIPEELFKKLIKSGFSKQDKTRLKWEGWDIDILEDGKVLAEYELEEGVNDIEVPEIFSVKKVGEGTDSSAS